MIAMKVNVSVQVLQEIDATQALNAIKSSNSAWHLETIRDESYRYHNTR